MITENVKIMVLSDGQKYERIVKVVSDGSYGHVTKLVETYARQHFHGRKVEKISWMYVDNDSQETIR
jgi:hypothetical protein